VSTELGGERAAELLRDAVREYATGMGEQVSGSVDGTPLDAIRYLVPTWKFGEALQIEEVADNENELSFNVRGCKFAEFFKSIGEPEFGAMITCECDPPLTEAIGGLEMERTQTIMGGDSHCDFRWKKA